MKFASFFILIIGCVSAFNMGAPSSRHGAAFISSRIARSSRTQLFEKGTEMIPVEKTTIEQAAGVTGGILGLILAGPVGAIVFAAISNFVAKKDNEAGEAIRGVGKTIVESFNFLTKLNDKYNLTGKAATAIGGAVSSIETESEALETVKNTLTTVTAKVDELNKEYDLVGKGAEALKAAAAFSDTAIEKVIELNEKYDFVETSKSLASTAVTKIREQTNKD